MYYLYQRVSKFNFTGSATPFYRYWNGRNHFYTTYADEIGTTTKGERGNHGYTSEGTQCQIFISQVPGSKPLYRYQNGQNHFYTQDSSEIGTAKTGVKGKHGYISEGIAGYCFPSKYPGTVPLYRYYGNEDHFYTTDAKEIGTVVPGAKGRHGYKSEGIVCYVIPAQGSFASECTVNCFFSVKNLLVKLCIIKG